MGRLVNPGLGDLIDRLTILALKIVHGEDRGRDVKPFITEREALLKQLGADASPLAATGATLIMELGAVNAALWQAEDQVRALRGGRSVGGLPDGVELAFRIQALNDRRSELIDELNEVGGFIAAEKKL